MVFKPKKFKQKIGTKAEAGAGSEIKHFTNGHKSFTAAEAKGMTEQQTRENVTLAVFEKLKSTYIRPRNPLCGEQTPRDGNRMGESRVEGFLLFPPEHDEVKPGTPPEYSMWSKRNRPKEATLKVGQLEDAVAKLAVESSPVAPKTSPPMVRELKRIGAMRLMQNTMGGELDFLYSKLEGRQTKISSHLMHNTRQTESERDAARRALVGQR